MAELAGLKSRRGVLRRSVTNCIRKIEANLESPVVNLDELEESFEILKNKEIDLKAIDEKIENSVSDLKELETEIESAQEYIDKIIIWKLKADKKLKEQKRNVNINSSDSKIGKSEYLSDNVKLPKLNLPTFSGNLIEWITFKDLFNASIRNNTNLSNAQKLQYLKASLKGDAYRIVQTIAISDENFDLAWNLLDERFSNKREQIFANIKRLLNLSQIHNESPNAVLNLVDVLNEIIRSLEILDQNISGFSDTLILYLVLQKLDNSSKLWWERQLKGNEIPKLKEFIDFLKNHARTLQNSQVSVHKVNKPTYHNKVHAMVATQACIFCKEDHYLSKCSKFLNLTTHQRIEFVKSNHLCYNCLSNMHILKKCKSLNTCLHCGKKHHSTLHFNNVNKPTSIPPVNALDKQTSSNLSHKAEVFIPTSHNNFASSNQQIETTGNEKDCSTVCANYCDNNNLHFGKKRNHMLLCTAIIKVKNSSNEFTECRCLLDSGSEKSFIRKDCVKKLGLPIIESSISVSCLGTFNTLSKGEVNLLFKPHFNEKFSVSTSAYVIDKITGKIPSCTLPFELQEEFQDLVLADPSFNVSSEIDILLGVNVFFTVLNGEIKKRDSNLPFAISSKLGWILSGATSFEIPKCHQVSVNNLSTDELIKSFWELEQLPTAQILSQEENQCETLFKETHKRNKFGRFSVKLPFKPNRQQLGDSKSIAFSKFLSLEKRLLKAPDVYQQYKNFMTEYLTLGHMEKLPEDAIDKENEHFYIPHHHVINESSQTTKLRVVFNASSPSTTKVSLNDILMNGPKVQDDLFAILLRFRCQNIAIIADLQKMYRQIQVHEEDRNFQRIVWRDDPSKPIKAYRLTTVTYGTTPAAYLATRALNQLAYDESEKFPNASEILLHNFYVDDALFGAENPQKAIEIISELSELLKRGGFHLHKWCTNNQEVLKHVLKTQYDNNTLYQVTENKTIKVLGLKWQPEQDEFTYNISMDKEKNQATKRTILSFISKIFDPLGWLSPFSITAKIMMQELWKENLAWDDPVPEKIIKSWASYCEDIKSLEIIRIPRKAILLETSRTELHCFCDASEKAYAAVIYLKTTNSNSTLISLLTAKTRVAPIKTQSIPRLELCSAVLLVHLVKAVQNSLQIQIDAIYAWSDSMIVLSWLQSEPTRWKTFVANRVSEIQSILPAHHWNHVKSEDNPADCSSRGLCLSDLVNHELWWSGPAWLKTTDMMSTSKVLDCSESLIEERKNYFCGISELNDELPILRQVSSFTKLKRILAWCLRFISNIRLSASERNFGHLTSDEVRRALTCIVKQVQNSEFQADIQCIKSKGFLPKSSKLINLSPFIDKEGVLRVGGRLQNSDLEFNAKHPIVLPSKHKFSKIICEHYHKKHLHVGPQSLLYCIRQNYWIINGRNLARRVVFECVTCFRAKPVTVEQIMGNLPKERVTTGFPFNHTGVDFCGPFFIKYKGQRKGIFHKIYVALFICLSTKAIHLEIVSDLTSESFIKTLERFISRRGKCSKLFSDNAKNFVGACNEIKKLHKLISCPDYTLSKYYASEKIDWHFIPPRSPHFGGLWEAGIKSLKYHFKRVVGDSKFTYEEFLTIIVKIEGILNSRPLTPLSSDPKDLEVLTPAHFLIGRPISAIPLPELIEYPDNRLKRWERVSKYVQIVWKKWKHDYLNNLQSRSKWLFNKDNVQIGQMVLIKEDELPCCKWLLGRILDTYSGTDKKIRVVKVLTRNGELKRPVVKIAILPIET